MSIQHEMDAIFLKSYYNSRFDDPQFRVDLLVLVPVVFPDINDQIHFLQRIDRTEGRVGVRDALLRQLMGNEVTFGERVKDRLLDVLVQNNGQYPKEWNVWQEWQRRMQKYAPDFFSGRTPKSNIDKSPERRRYAY